MSEIGRPRCQTTGTRARLLSSQDDHALGTEATMSKPDCTAALSRMMPYIASINVEVGRKTWVMLPSKASRRSVVKIASAAALQWTRMGSTGTYANQS